MSVGHFVIVMHFRFTRTKLLPNSDKALYGGFARRVDWEDDSVCCVANFTLIRIGITYELCFGSLLSRLDKKLRLNSKSTFLSRWTGMINLAGQITQCTAYTCIKNYNKLNGDSG